MYNDRIKQLRQGMGLNQIQLAEQIGLKGKVSTLRMWELGNSTPTLASLITMADFFGVTLDYLTGRSDDQMKVNVPDNELHLPPLVRGDYRSLKKHLALLSNHCDGFHTEVFSLLQKLFDDLEWVCTGKYAEIARQSADDGILQYDDHLTDNLSKDLVCVESKIISPLRMALSEIIFEKYRQKVISSPDDLEIELEATAEERECEEENQQELADMQTSDMIDRRD